VTKYFDAGKEVASHAVLLPDGMRFSAGTTRRDFSDEIIDQIKKFYAQFADGEGRLPLEKYLAATLDARETLTGGAKSIEAVAAERGLNVRYLSTLWTMLSGAGETPAPQQPSLLLATLRAHWRGAKPGDAAALAAEVAGWQNVLARFQNVGHMKPWVVPIDPLTSRQEIRFKLPEPPDGKEVTVYLSAGEAGDGSTGDLVVWENH